MIKKSFHIAIWTLLTAAAVLPASAASFPVVSGVVRDARGTPEMGALVQLLRSDSTVLAEAYTNLNGDYRFEHVFPGVYQLKATAASFLPTLRENLRVKKSGMTVANLTLNTLFEAIQWLPAEPRAPNEPNDDWKWTLRSSSNRPLLRFLQDGPLVVVSSGDSQSAPELEARVAFAGATHQFGQSSGGGVFEIERSAANDGHLILRADVGPEDYRTAQFIAGYEQTLGPGREIRTMVATQQTPAIRGANGPETIRTVMMRSAESVQLGSNLAAEIGNQIESVGGASRAISSSPFASIAWHSGGIRFSYNVATSPMVQSADAIADPLTLLPDYSLTDGVMRSERGLHQEIRIEDDEEALRALVAFYRDTIANPIIAGGGFPNQDDLASGSLLYDPVAQVTRVAGPAYSTTGLEAQVDRRLGHAVWASLSFAQGRALYFPVATSQTTVAAALKTLYADRAEAVTGTVSGSFASTGTRWRASYRWQPSATLTPVALYDSYGQSPYLSFMIRQPIRCGRLLPNRTEALISVRNLLEQGYRPLLTPDGSTLYFAQATQSIQGGLSFSF